MVKSANWLLVVPCLKNCRMDECHILNLVHVFVLVLLAKEEQTRKIHRTACAFMPQVWVFLDRNCRALLFAHKDASSKSLQRD